MGNMIKETPIIDKEIHREAYAKVNLFLNVVNRRADGYHNLEMVNARIDLADDLYFKIGGAQQITINSNDPYFLSNDNLLIRIARYLLNTYDPKQKVTIKIDKRIPPGGGLGGNSADAAAVIQGLNDLFGWRLSKATMTAIAVRFGADVPYCLSNLVALVKGIGDEVTELDVDLSCYKVLVVKPKIFVSTEEIFSRGDDIGFINYDIKPLLEAIKQKRPMDIIDQLHNSLEEITFLQYPKIRDIKAELVYNVGQKGVVMTGSGSTIVKLITEVTADISQYLSRYSDKYSINIYNFIEKTR